MARTPDIKAKMIRTAAALFRQRGYNGVGLTELLTASGAPKGSFYYHFPGGKEQLAEAAVRYAGQGVGRLIDETLQSAPDLSTGIRMLAEAIAEWHEKTGYLEGCPITSVVLDTVPQSEAISTAVRAVFADWEQRMVAHARRFGDNGFNHADGLRLLMLIEGAWILARAYRSKDPMLSAAEFFIASLSKDEARLRP